MASAEAIRVGIIGSGLIATVHSGAYGRASGLAPRPFALTRLASRNLATGQELARRFGWGAVTADWREVTRAPDVDVVDICTPEEAHCEMTLDALAHGKHVLCEKPLAARVADAGRMWQAAREAGRVHMTGFVLRHWPVFERAKRVIASGAVGSIRHVRASYHSDAHTLLESSLRGLGSHVLDAAIDVVGPVASAAAMQRPSQADASVDGAVSALLRFESGSTGSLEVDREARGREVDIALAFEGELGAVSMTWRRREQLEVFVDAPAGALMGPQHVALRGIGRPPVVPWHGSGFGVDGLFVAQACTLATAVSGEKVDYADFGAGWRVAAASEAIAAAWHGDAWIDVEEEARPR